jgi:hypothetical protein
MNAPSSGENFRCVRATFEDGYFDEVGHVGMNLCRM